MAHPSIQLSQCIEIRDNDLAATAVLENVTAATNVLEHVKWLWLQPQAF